MCPCKLSVKNLLSFVGDLERNLANRTNDSSKTVSLTSVALRAARVNQRLHEPTADQWSEYLKAVEQRPETDVVRTHLFGTGEGTIIDSREYLSISARIVLEFAEFEGEQHAY
jgi:hypothetical protein